MEQAVSPGDAVVAKGKILYEQTIRPRLEAGNEGKYLVIDTLSGGYEFDADDLTAMRRAREKYPEGVFYVMRIGHRTLGRLGAGNLRRRS